MQSLWYPTCPPTGSGMDPLRLFPCNSNVVNGELRQKFEMDARMAPVSSFCSREITADLGLAVAGFIMYGARELVASQDQLLELVELGDGRT